MTTPHIHTYSSQNETGVHISIVYNVHMVVTGGRGGLGGHQDGLELGTVVRCKMTGRLTSCCKFIRPTQWRYCFDVPLQRLFKLWERQPRDRQLWRRGAR